MQNGRSSTWAAGIVYAVGSNNFIFDKSQPIHMAAKELTAPFGVAGNAMLWLVSIDGFSVDARTLPAEMQEICYEKGLIPYIPAHNDHGK